MQGVLPSVSPPQGTIFASVSHAGVWRFVPAIKDIYGMFPHGPALLPDLISVPYRYRVKP